MNKLTKQEKDNWLKGLRSGKYSQTMGRLRVTEKIIQEEESNSTVGYCCIGVYAKCNEINISKDGMSMIVDKKDVGYKPLKNKIGEDLVSKLYRMNDNEKKTFLEIADFIESNIQAV